MGTRRTQGAAVPHGWVDLNRFPIKLHVNPKRSPAPVPSGVVDGTALRCGFVQGLSILPRTAQTTPPWAVTGEKPPPGATGHTAWHRAAPSRVPSMDPTVPRATLKAMGLCTLLVLLVAAVTAAVAVLLWRSEALGKLRGCRERAANESRALELRVAQLERERDRLQRMADERGREEDALRRELSRVRKDGEKLSSGLRSCRERAVGAVGSLGIISPLWGFRVGEGDAGMRGGP